MQTMRFSAIAADLERKIREGVFADKMPTTLELTGLYRCGKCTITNALCALEQSGLLHLESRRGGLAIDRSRLRSGLIGMVGSWIVESDFGPDSEFGRTMATMRRDGFEPVTVRYSSELDNARSIQLFHNGFDGLIFTNSSLNEEVALSLEAKHIPFISCNRLLLHRRLNFIGFDLFEPLTELTDLLIARGYRTLAFMIPGRVEGFNQAARKNWIRLKRSRNLPILPCDRLLLNWRDDRREQLRQFLDCCRQNHIVPDAMIFWGSLEDDMIQAFHAGFSIPLPTLLIASVSAQPPPPDCIAIHTVSTGTLFAHAYEALRELIYAPSGKFIKRFLTQPAPWIYGEIPFRR